MKNTIYIIVTLLGLLLARALKLSLANKLQDSLAARVIVGQAPAQAAYRNK